MTFFANVDPNLEVAKGNVAKSSILHKFGRNPSVGTSFVAIAEGGLYEIILNTNATTLRIKAGGNAGDTQFGLGGREVVLQGLNETGAFVEESLSTDGSTASLSTTTTFMRLFRVFVSKSGDDEGNPPVSHVDDIVIESSSGTEDWAIISATDVPRSQTTISCFSVPLNTTAFIESFVINVESNKTADVQFYIRENILETVAPFTPYRLQQETIAVSGFQPIVFANPRRIEALTDIIFLAKAQVGTADVSVDFDITLVED